MVIIITATTITITVMSKPLARFLGGA